MLHGRRAALVAFVSYGGMAGGLRAVEALRLVFTELHSVTIRDTVSLDSASAEALQQMMRQLLWWADASTEHGNACPIPPNPRSPPSTVRRRAAEADRAGHGSIGSLPFG